MSFLTRWFSSSCSAPQRWVVQWATVNGRRVNVEEIAQEQALRLGEARKKWEVSCSAALNEYNEMETSSLVVWLNTETHGKWAMHKTTQAVKDILKNEYGAYIPWYKE